MSGVSIYIAVPTFRTRAAIDTWATGVQRAACARLERSALVLLFGFRGAAAPDDDDYLLGVIDEMASRSIQRFDNAATPQKAN